MTGEKKDLKESGDAGNWAEGEGGLDPS